MKRWLRTLWCRHHRVRCVHGDEIIGRLGARVACRDCGKSLHDRPLPYLCFFTGKPHFSREDGVLVW